MCTVVDLFIYLLFNIFYSKFLFQMVSCKFLFDDGESDEVFIDEWAASGGISVKELVHLEKDFLKAIVS